MGTASATIKVTMVDLADCRTTLYYLSQSPNDPALPFATAEVYSNLHSTLWETPRKFSDLRPGYSPAILKMVSPAYRENKYWRKATGLDDLPNYWMSAWKSILPLECTLKDRIAFVGGHFNFKVSPLPRVLLYPFGWSTKLSFRLSGDHTLEDLSRFVQYAVNQKCISIQSTTGTDSDPISLSKYFSRVATGIRADAFGDNKTSDKGPQGLIIVTTVVEKYGFGPTSPPDDDHEKNLMLRIVSPEGPLPSGTWDTFVYQRNPDDSLEFLLFKDRGRFIWNENLLDKKGESWEGQHRAWLHCHHNNSILSLVHALHLHELIIAVDGELKFKKSLPEPVLQLVDAAYRQLSSPGYKNASLRAFLDGKDVQGSIKTAVDLTSKKP
jgi:hypothetical protein